MSFLYYYAGNGPIPDELRYAVRSDEPHHRRQVMRGPLNQDAGTIVAHESTDAALVRFAEAKQTWKPFPYDSKLCVGLPHGSELRPELLVRPDALPGHWVTLGDGSKWCIPVVRKFDEDLEGFYLTLPPALELDCSTGLWKPKGVQRRYQRLYELVTGHLELRRQSTEANLVEYSDPDIDLLTIEAIKTNYRVNSIELSFFEGAYTIESRQSIIDSIIDLNTFLDWHRKKSDAVTSDA